MHEESFIEDIIEDPPHVTLTNNTEDWESFHDYFSDDDHICTLDLPQRETITESCDETYDEISNVYDSTLACSPYNDESLESLLPCDLFSEEDDPDKEEDKYSLGCDASDEESLISDVDGGDEYWNFMEKR